MHLLQPMARTHSQTVVVENPMSVDESGKLVISLAQFSIPSLSSSLKKEMPTLILNAVGEQCRCRGNYREKVICSGSHALAVKMEFGNCFVYIEEIVVIHVLKENYFKFWKKLGQ